MVAGFLGQEPVHAAAPRPAPRGVEPERRSSLRWLLPLAIGLGLLAGFWSVLHRGRDERAVSERAPDVAAPLPAAGLLLRRSLPDGVQLAIPQTGFESRLVSFLSDAEASLGDSWFDFDRLLFETDSAALTRSSRDQLANLAEILKAYPSVQIEIGGYTDDTGDATHNLELSRARANVVRDELVAFGVSASRLEAEGYGQDYPVASNDTDAGRAQNRRIAMRVTAR